MESIEASTCPSRPRWPPAPGVASYLATKRSRKSSSLAGPYCAPKRSAYRGSRLAARRSRTALPQPSLSSVMSTVGYCRCSEPQPCCDACASACCSSVVHSASDSSPGTTCGKPSRRGSARAKPRAKAACTLLENPLAEPPPCNRMRAIAAARRTMSRWSFGRSITPTRCSVTLRRRGLRQRASSTAHRITRERRRARRERGTAIQRRSMRGSSLSPDASLLFLAATKAEPPLIRFSLQHGLRLPPRRLQRGSRDEYASL